MAKTSAVLDILLKLDDKATTALKNKLGMLDKQTTKTGKNWAKTWIRNAALMTAAILVVRKLSQAFTNFTKSLIEVSNEVEQFGVRLKVVLGGVEEGNQVFADMTELAGKVPKTYQEIMSAATDLSAVVRGGAEEVKSLMPIIVDISAATGLTVREATGQIIRMYSAGAAAADMFRERGISAALGFKAGVSTTAEETMKILTDQWADGTGKFVGAADELAKTFTGMTSMMQDAWFIFKRDVGAALFEKIKLDMSAILVLIQRSKEKGGKYAQVVKDLGDGFADLFRKARDFVGILFVGAGHVKDAWDGFMLIVVELKGMFDSATIGAQNLLIAVAKIFRQDTTNFEETLAEMESQMTDTMIRIDALRDQHDVNASEGMRLRLEEFRALFAEIKAEMATVTEGAAPSKEDGEGEKKSGGMFGKFQTDAKKALKDLENLGKQTSKVMMKTINTFSTGFGNAFAQMVVNGKDFGEAMKATFKQMAIQALASIAAIIAKMLILRALGYVGPVGGDMVGEGGGGKSFLKLFGLAKGGTVTRTGSFLVGEQGPEVVNLPTGAAVTPNTGSASIEINMDNVSFNNEEDVEDVLERISDLMENKSRSAI